MKLSDRRAYGILLFFGILIYARGLTGTFVLFDDDLHIFQNPLLRLPLMDAISFVWTNPFHGLFMPVTYTFWFLTSAISGLLFPGQVGEALPSLPFHVLSLLFHLVNVLGVFWLARRWFSVRASLIGAFFFLAHPLQVETVSWATGFKDLCCVFFSLLCFASFHLSVKATDFPKQMAWYFASVIAFVFAVLGKPAALVLPILIGGCEFLFEKVAYRRLLLLLPWFVLALPLSWMTAGLQPLEINMVAVPLWGRPFIAADALLFYIRKLILPFPLVHDYSRLPLAILESGKGFIAFLVCVAVTAFLAWKRQWKGLAGFVGLAVLMAPILGFVQFAFQNFSTVADHYIYLSLIWLALLGSSCVDSLWEKRVARVTMQSLLGIWAFLSFLQVGVWRDSPTLLGHTLAYNPQSILAHNNLAVWYESKGDYESSLSHYEKSAAIAPHFAHHHYNVGNLQMKLGLLTEATEKFYQALALDPKTKDAYFNLGIIAEGRGKKAEALEFFNKVLAIDPMSSKAYVKLGDLKVSAGDLAGAKESFRTALEIDPLSHQAHFRMGKLLAKQKKYDEARREFNYVLQLNPTTVGLNEALQSLP